MPQSRPSISGAATPNDPEHICAPSEPRFSSVRRLLKIDAEGEDRQEDCDRESELDIIAVEDTVTAHGVAVVELRNCSRD
jgi:hypothetical protein